MDRIDVVVYNIAMTVGDSPTTKREKALQNLVAKVLVSRRSTLDASWDFDLVSPFWRLYVQRSSGAAIAWKGQTLALEPGRLYLIPAWLRFQTRTEIPLEQDYLHFLLAGLPADLQRRLFDRPFTLDLDSRLAPLQKVWSEGLSHPEMGLADYSWAMSLVQACLAEVFCQLEPAGPEAFFRSFSEESPVHPALECIAGRLADPPAVTELARLCRMSRDHFIRVFRTWTGTTPAQYSLDRRVEEAAGLLTDTGRSIKDIAEATGFVDRFHFTKVIKARLGLPPAEYRRLHLAH